MPTHLVKSTANGLLALLRSMPTGSRLPSEAELSAKLGVSRSPVRSALRLLGRRGVVRRHQGSTVVARAGRPSDSFVATAAHASKADAFTAYFLRKLQRGELPPGARFSELELAREAGLTTVTVREGLLRFARFGVIEKDPRRSWRMIDLDARAVDELFDVRELLELSVLEKALRVPDDDPVRVELAAVLAAHRRFAALPQRRVERFLELDERFHAALFRAGANRFLDHMFATVSMTLHFQLQRNEVGVRGMEQGLAQHPPIMEAILAGDAAAARRGLRAHLASARAIMHEAARNRSGASSG
ncbi:MAG: GntR family transcriptional regulator [Planctomycetes bacterium]|nr:GntR family transcriptional regulator [Planctomycetota bacterium]